MSAGHVISAEPAHWQRVKAVRLRALALSPDAFASTLEREGAFRPEHWQARLTSTQARTFLAVSSASGSDVGLVTGAAYQGRPKAAGLFGLWVEPDARSAGFGAALVQAVITWAGDAGYEKLYLDVALDNLPAGRLYSSQGFEDTGLRSTLPPPREHIAEREMVYELG